MTVVDLSVLSCWVAGWMGKSVTNYPKPLLWRCHAGNVTTQRGVNSVARPRHPDGHHEQLFRKAEQKGWRINGGGDSHFKMMCPCEDKHMITISTTPKNVSVNLRVVIRNLRRTCWREAP